MRTLKALSALLTYPSEGLITALPEIAAAVEADKLIGRADRAGLLALVAHLKEGDLFDRQEAFGLLFDRTRSLSLHLFEHVHGESRDRGQAMVDLIKVYEDGGFTPTTEELPDFLPLFLEFASTRAPQEAIDLIAQPAHVISALAERLAKRKSPYQAIFRTLLVLAKAKPDKAALAALLAEPDPEPDDLEALDAAWEEEEVTFGPGATANCGKDGLASKLRQATRLAPGMDAPVPTPRTTIHHSGSRP
ncbi:MAG: nitrate reductase molybdenum cofactor assembly chaperone [Rhizobiales bacterium PAR1]|nr:MAG: nitrate reductase molybdenum cofactor assembly chaperone [Rhizobiales bacterium PAR1]